MESRARGTIPLPFSASRGSAVRAPAGLRGKIALRQAPQRHAFPIPRKSPALPDFYTAARAAADRVARSFNRETALRFPSKPATQGELAEGQEKVAWAMRVGFDTSTQPPWAASFGYRDAVSTGTASRI